MNTITLAGRLTKDPEVMQTPAGATVCHFSVAENARKDETNFFDCSVFGKQAEYVGKNMKKGTSVVVTGRMVQTTKDTQNGKRTYWGVTASNVQYAPRSSAQESEQEPLPFN